MSKESHRDLPRAHSKLLMAAPYMSLKICLPCKPLSQPYRALPFTALHASTQEMPVSPLTHPPDTMRPMSQASSHAAWLAEVLKPGLVHTYTDLAAHRNSKEMLHRYKQSRPDELPPWQVAACAKFAACLGYLDTSAHFQVPTVFPV